MLWRLIHSAFLGRAFARVLRCEARRPARRAAYRATRRSRNLSYLVAQSRSFIVQLDLARAELADERDPQLDQLLDLVAAATAAVLTAERLATTQLRATRGT